MQRLAAVLAVLCCGLLAGAAIDASQNAPRAQFDNLEEQFKYGSVGIESEEGIPLLDLAGASACIRRQIAAGPAATTRSGSSGSPATSCRSDFRQRICSAVRASPSTARSATRARIGSTRRVPRTLVTAGPGNLVNPQAYVRFLHTVADDPRFNAGELLKAIDGLTNLSWMRRMQYRMLLIPGTRRALQRQKEAIRVDGSQSRLGRGAHRSVQSDQVPPPEAADRHAASATPT